MTRKCNSVECYNHAQYKVRTTMIKSMGEGDSGAFKFLICNTHYKMLNPDNKRTLILDEEQFMQRWSGLRRSDAKIEVVEDKTKYNIGAALFRFRRLIK